MTVILDQYKFAYFAVPKVACTSIKTMFFKIENGFEFRNFKSSGRPWWIHHFYKSIPFEDQKHARVEGYTRLAVVRDPVARLLSCYGNRVIHHRELSREKAQRPLTRAGLPFDPSLSTFVGNLRGYMDAIGSINHHASPIVTYLGRDAGYYTRVFGMSELDAFTAQIGELTGHDAVLPRLQTGGPKIERDAMTEAELRTVQEFYAEDYAVYGHYF